MRVASSLLVASLSTCATVSTRISTKPTPKEQYTKVSAPTGETVEGAVEAEGTMLVGRFTTHRRCESETFQNILYEEWVVREANDVVVWEYVLGAAVVVTGAIFLGVPGVVDAIDPDDPELYRNVAGWSGVAIGTGLLVAGIVDSVEAADGPGATYTRPKRIDRSEVPCGSAPLQLALVAWRADTGEGGPLGQTDAMGMLKVDLRTLLTEELFARDEPVRRVTVLVAGVDVGHVDTTLIADRVAEQAYADAERKASLEGLQRFAARFPWSRHRSAADAAIAQRLAQREAADWKAASKARSVEGYRSYLDVHKRGAHASEAYTALVEHHIRRGEFEEARRLVGLTATAGVSSDKADALLARIERAQANERRRVAGLGGQALALSRPCGASLDQNRVIAKSAYAVLSSGRGKLPAAEFARVSKAIQAACRVSPQAVGFAW